MTGLAKWLTGLDVELERVTTVLVLDSEYLVSYCKEILILRMETARLGAKCTTLRRSAT